MWLEAHSSMMIIYVLCLESLWFHMRHQWTMKECSTFFVILSTNLFKFHMSAVWKSRTIVQWSKSESCSSCWNGCCWNGSSGNFEDKLFSIVVLSFEASVITAVERFRICKSCNFSAWTIHLGEWPYHSNIQGMQIILFSS